MPAGGCTALKGRKEGAVVLGRGVVALMQKSPPGPGSKLLGEAGVILTGLAGRGRAVFPLHRQGRLMWFASCPWLCPRHRLCKCQAEAPPASGRLLVIRKYPEIAGRGNARATKMAGEGPCPRLCSENGTGSWRGAALSACEQDSLRQPRSKLPAQVGEDLGYVTP